MAQGIKNRIFGSDVPTSIKRKIEARQKLAYSDQNPHSNIQSQYDTDKTDNTSFDTSE